MDLGHVPRLHRNRTIAPSSSQTSAPEVVITSRKPSVVDSAASGLASVSVAFIPYAISNAVADFLARRPERPLGRSPDSPSFPETTDPRIHHAYTIIPSQGINQPIDPGRASIARVRQLDGVGRVRSGWNSRLVRGATIARSAHGGSLALPHHAGGKTSLAPRRLDVFFQKTVRVFSDISRPRKGPGPAFVVADAGRLAGIVIVAVF